MKQKLLCLLLALTLALSLAACGGGNDSDNGSGGSAPAVSAPDGADSSAEKSADLEKFYTDTRDSLEGLAEMMEIPADTLESFYQGLTDLEPKQTAAYMSMISAAACELTAVELGSADDAEAARGIFQARVDSQIEQGAFYPAAIEQWTDHSEIVVNGNYVLLVVSPEAETFVANFNAVTQ